MDTNALEVIGTVGAGSGGVVATFLLIRALWKLISGQLAEQRNLLKDAREGTQAVAAERDNLRERIDAINASHSLDSERRDEVIRKLREVYHDEIVYRQKLSEYATHLRAKLISECGYDPAKIDPFPKRD